MFNWINNLTTPNGATINWGKTFKSRNGGTPSGAAVSKRAATKRRNMRARSSRK